MCGIIGYTGTNPSPEKILGGLKALAYRGYDSAGMALCTEEGVKIIKSAGKVERLAEKAVRAGDISSFCAIGHTRWATHGAPTEENAHPHRVGTVTLVHNGIIENEGELRRQLEGEGMTFSSDTDTEVAAAVVYRRYLATGDPIAALREAESVLRGAYAFGVLFDDRPGEIYALRRQSPLLVALGDDGLYLASDLPAVLAHTNRRFSLDEGELAVLTPQGVTVFDRLGKPVGKTVQTDGGDIGSAEKDGYPHFMLKEIHEQPDAVRRTVLPRVREGMPFLAAEGLTDELLRSVRGLRIVACGTAYHAGMVGKTMVESLARLPVTVEIASEFRYSNPILSPDEPVILVSQSGETADTLAALRLAKEQNIPTLAIVNVKGSALAREADFVFYTHAGPEIAVASTKAYCVQLAAFALIALRAAYVRGVLSEEETRKMTAYLGTEVPTVLQSAVGNDADAVTFAREIRDSEHVFYLGRGVDYSLSLEGSLKLKEISYIHSEAYAAGELKHGTLSLITQDTPVIVTASDPRLFEKTVGSLKEAAARGGKILLLASPKLLPVDGVARRLVLPEVPPFFAPFASLPLLQRIAYETAVMRGCDVDQPRNLAKSVTVE